LEIGDLKVYTGDVGYKKPYRYRTPSGIFYHLKIKGKI
jgi:hypothetical protein